MAACFSSPLVNRSHVSSGDVNDSAAVRTSTSSPTQKQNESADFAETRRASFVSAIIVRLTKYRAVYVFVRRDHIPTRRQLKGVVLNR